VYHPGFECFGTSPTHTPRTGTQPGDQGIRVERKLVEQAMHGDEAAFDALIGRVGDQLHSVARNHRLRVKAAVPEDDPVVPSVS